MSEAPGRILVPVDGSDNARRALRFALRAVARAPETVIELLNVQPAVPGSVSMFLPKSEINAFHREEAMKVLAPALQEAADAGATVDHHIGVGDPGAVIAKFATQLGCTQIVMG